MLKCAKGKHLIAAAVPCAGVSADVTFDRHTHIHTHTHTHTHCLLHPTRQSVLLKLSEFVHNGRAGKATSAEIEVRQSTVHATDDVTTAALI